MEGPGAVRGGPEGTAPYFDPRGHFRGAETGVRLGLSLFVRASLYRPVRHPRHVPSKKIPVVAFGLQRPQHGDGLEEVLQPAPAPRQPSAFGLRQPCCVEPSSAQLMTRPIMRSFFTAASNTRMVSSFQ